MEERISHHPSGRLPHAQVQEVMKALGESDVFNLDASIRTLIEPAAAAIKLDPGSEVSLHILCCNEYGLVTP
jgi:hypothetical protein